MAGALGEPNHTLVPCWMPKPLPPRNQCTGWFTLADGGGGEGFSWDVDWQDDTWWAQKLEKT